jgi:hypothetical protein
MKKEALEEIHLADDDSAPHTEWLKTTDMTASQFWRLKNI